MVDFSKAFDTVVYAILLKKLCTIVYEAVL